MIDTIGVAERGGGTGQPRVAYMACICQLGSRTRQDGVRVGCASRIPCIVRRADPVDNRLAAHGVSGAVEADCSGQG